MGRLVLLLGIVLLLAGIGGMALGFVPSFQLPTVATGTEDLQAKLCRDGETLVTAGGPSEYRPGQGYSRSVTYYCEDAEGNRRDVTGQFAQDLFGQIGQVFSSISFGFRFEFIALFIIGLLLTIVGAATIRRRVRTVMVGGVPLSVSTGPVVRIAGREVVQGPELSDALQQAMRIKQASPNASGGDLVARLNQLEEARRANLITPEEYDHLRKQILDRID